MNKMRNNSFLWKTTIYTQASCFLNMIPFPCPIINLLFDLVTILANVESKYLLLKIFLSTLPAWYMIAIIFRIVIYVLKFIAHTFFCCIWTFSCLYDLIVHIVWKSCGNHSFLFVQSFRFFNSLLFSQYLPS